MHRICHPCQPLVESYCDRIRQDPMMAIWHRVHPHAGCNTPFDLIYEIVGLATLLHYSDIEPAEDRDGWYSCLPALLVIQKLDVRSMDE